MKVLIGCCFVQLHIIIMPDLEAAGARLPLFEVPNFAEVISNMDKFMWGLNLEPPKDAHDFIP